MLLQDIRKSGFGYGPVWLLLRPIRRSIFGVGTTVCPMSDLAHFIYYQRFLNPALADQPSVDLPSLFREKRSIQELCWGGAGRGFEDNVAFVVAGNTTLVLGYSSFNPRPNFVTTTECSVAFSGLLIDRWIMRV